MGAGQQVGSLQASNGALPLLLLAPCRHLPRTDPLPLPLPSPPPMPRISFIHCDRATCPCGDRCTNRPFVELQAGGACRCLAASVGGAVARIAQQLLYCAGLLLLLLLLLLLDFAAAVLLPLLSDFLWCG